MLDPYREEMLDKNFNTFSFGGHLNFEAYVQYQEYFGFAKAMDTLRGMKLMLKGDDGKAVACNIKVLQVLISFEYYLHMSIIKGLFIYFFGSKCLLISSIEKLIHINFK